MSRYATIDIGTNTVLLLVAERSAGQPSFEPVVERAEITRLGRGVDRSGRLAARAIEDTVEVVSRFAAEARTLGARGIACVATSAARDAANGADFFEAAREAGGLVPEVISGDEEARLVWSSAWRDFGGGGGRAPLQAGAGALVVLDVGGGSTEVCVGSGPAPHARRSLQIGAVRLTERIAPADPPDTGALSAMRSRAAESLQSAVELLPGGGRAPALRNSGGRAPALPNSERQASGAPHDGPSGRMVGVAGTVTTLAAVERKLAVYDAGVVHGAELSRTALEGLFVELGTLTTAERARLPGMEPKRADVIVAGCAIVLEAMRLLGFDRLTVSDRGVRWGLLYDRFGVE
jgi:exopolyphosphatase/guanosine-5'-triphosphate,3'-diphosphate pyrophosphatase